MKTVKKIIILIISIILILIIGLLITVNRLSKRGLPDYKHDLVLKGLEKPVKVYYDSIGVPHIFASTQSDLYLATGYVMARERMWQMDLLRRVTLGRLSEIFGDEYIQTDLLLRSMRYSEKSERVLNSSGQEISLALKMFSEGVNKYIDEYKGNYPVEFFILGYEPEKWTPIHSANLISYMAWDLKAGWSELVLEQIATKVDSIHLAEILPDVPAENITIFKSDSNKLLASNIILNLIKLDKLGCDILSGSNNWAVSAKKSSTGKPLLANDMHLAFNVPGIWFQMHQVVEGELNVTGLAVPGQPLIVVGHNDSIAWGMTNTYVDNLDYYEETINPADTNQYLFNGEWKNFEIRDETIVSKGGAKHEIQYRLNHRGPVVSGFKNIKDRVLTIRWVGDFESNEFRSIYLVNRAKNWEDFKNAFSTFKTISQNIAYADCNGNIGLYCCAGVPVRKRDKIFAVLPGATDEYDWQGLVPFDELPHVYNPECGYILSANNKTIDNSYPYHIGTWYALPYRYLRIKKMLEGKEKLDIHDFENMQNDFVSTYAEEFTQTMLKLIDSNDIQDKTMLEALDILKQWDYNMLAQLVAPTIFECWIGILTEQLYKDELGDEIFQQFISVYQLSSFGINTILKNRNSVWIDNVETDKIETLNDIANESFIKTIQELKDKLGSDISTWQWGNQHKLVLRHPLAKVKILDRVFKLNRGPFSVGGGSHTVSPYKYQVARPDLVVHGASHRNIFCPGNWDSSISVIPTGNSGICVSKFYCNQTRLYINGEYHPDYFSNYSIEKNKLYVLNILP